MVEKHRFTTAEVSELIGLPKWLIRIKAAKLGLNKGKGRVDKFTKKEILKIEKT